MSGIKVEMDHEGMDELLKCDALQAYLGALARNVTSDIDVYVESTRAVSEAYGDNANNNMLKRLTR